MRFYRYEFLIFMAFCFGSCAHMPKVKSCFTDAPRAKLDCTDKNDKDSIEFIINPAADDKCKPDLQKLVFHCDEGGILPFDLPLINPEIDKYVSIPFTDFGILLDYMNAQKPK